MTVVFDSRKAVRCLSALALASLAAQASAQLYFNDLFHPTLETGHINRIEPNGTGYTQLVNTGGGARGLALDMQGGKMYWADVNDLKIRRANLNGTGQEDLIDLPGGKEPAFPSALAVHGSAGKLYWGDQTLGTLNRSNLDGSAQETLLSTPFHRGLAIDEMNGKIYWSTSTSQFKGEIVRANLDGTGQETVVTSTDPEFKPNKIALDIAGGKIYWTDYVFDIVRRANLNGSDIQNLYLPPFNRNPQGIALDLQNGYVYWGQDIFIEQHEGKIMRMGLDGSNPQDISLGYGHVTELVYVAVPEPASALVLAGGIIWLLTRRRRR